MRTDRLAKLCALAFGVGFAAPTLAADADLPPWATVVLAGPDAAGGAPWRVKIIRGYSSIRTGSLPSPMHALSGVASYYWQGEKTANGELFNRRQMTAAHPTLPFGSQVRVTRVDTGDSVVVRINDRGPFKPGRVIDLSEGAAEQIGMTGRGLAAVRLELLSN